MPSIFEKPSLLGFRQEGGDLNAKRLESSKRVFMEAAMGKAKELGVDITELLSNPRYADIISNELTKTATSPTPTLSADYGMAESDFSIPVFQQEGGRDVYWRDVASALASETPQALTRFNQPVQPTSPATSAPAYSGPMAAVPSDRQTPLPGLGGGAVPTATSEFMNRLLKLPTSADVPSVVSTMFENARQQQPAGSRAERVAAAMKSGDFETKRTQYNQEAMRLGQPTQMDAQGNIVGRELTEPERMREFFKATGGNTMFSQTTDPAQRALQNEMMKQARAQATVNTFGSTPEERLANLQAETEARQILRSPLNSGVREVAPGVRAAFKDGQTVGVFAPGDGSPATMNDPLKKYVTNPDGSVSLNPNPPQILMSDEMKDTLDRQKIEGKTGGSPMERRLIAATQAAEERKKKMASDAAAANAPKTPSVETFASMFPDTGLGLALASPVSNAPTSSPAAPAVAAPAAPPSLGTSDTYYNNIGSAVGSAIGSLPVPVFATLRDDKSIAIDPNEAAQSKGRLMFSQEGIPFDKPVIPKNISAQMFNPEGGIYAGQYGKNAPVQYATDAISTAMRKLKK